MTSGTWGVVLPPCCPILCESTKGTPMTFAFTDNAQIDETWEMPTNLDEMLAQVDAILDDSFGLGGGDFTEHNEWALDAAIEGILNQMAPETIAAMIADQWEPSDDEMMAAFGTPWHDGL